VPTPAFNPEILAKVVAGGNKSCFDNYLLFVIYYDFILL
jgi:hypothetical protein